LSRWLLRPYAWRYEQLRAEMIRTRQSLRYLALAELLNRVGQHSDDLTLYELSVYSQNGEDGVLAEILRRTGTSSKYFVEIGASANEANCIFLADALGWRGLFVDADEGEYEALRAKYLGIDGVEVTRARVVRDNINSLLSDSAVPRDIDVLSIDIDGNDYWIWEALVEHSPRVVIIEFNGSIDPRRQLVQPYSPDRAWDESDFFGASLGALCRLGSTKGYSLVHVDLSGVNSFFVRNEFAAQFPRDRIRGRAFNMYLSGRRHPKHDALAGRYVDLESGS
jgi:hypothetical protein